VDVAATTSSISSGAFVGGAIGAEVAAANNTTPTPQAPKKKCPPKYANFFKQAPIFNNLAKQLNTKALFLMAQSSWETAYLGPHAQALNMMFGMTHAGGNDISYSSFQASANSYYKAYSPYVSNTSTMDQFTAGLKMFRLTATTLQIRVTTNT
jgi:hypothetical protein